MKKILAAIMAFFMSLSSSTDYTVAPSKTYTDEYYTVVEDSLPDYRAYYGGGEKASITAGCKTNNYYANGKRVTNKTGFWFIDGQSYSIGDSIKITDADGNTSNGKKKDDDGNAIIPKGAFKDGQAIIIPYAGTLQTQSKNGGSITSMVLKCSTANGTTYKIKITGMKYWYCDSQRKGDIQYHTGEEQQGKTFSAGNVVGYATTNTKITITPVLKNGKKGTCSLKQFYNGEYTKVKDP